MTFDAEDRELLENLMIHCGELRAELRRLRTGDLVARLSEAEREEIARRVFERVDAQLTPKLDRTDEAPRGRAPRAKYFRDR